MAKRKDLRMAKRKSMAKRKLITIDEPGYGEEEGPIDECFSCDGGCFIEGMCYHEDPQGNAATESLCSEYSGTWCGDSDGGGTLPPIPQTVCATDSDFMADSPIHGWCEMPQVAPSKDVCWHAGCSPYEMGEGEHGCWCEHQGPCEILGGVFQGNTCEQEMRYWEFEAMNAIVTSGTCVNVSTSWGEEIASAMKWLAQQCCQNYPATLCAPEATIVTPCKDEGDFESDTNMHGWCEYHTVPQREVCSGAACHFWEDEGSSSGYTSCHCETQDQCEAVGGRYKGYTCSDEATNWGEQGDLLRQAQDQGTCDGITMSWGETLEQWVRHPATQCCRSSPANACNPNARMMTPCKDDADFDPEATLHEWCEMSTQPSQELCEEARCNFWADEWNSGCHCDNEASCTSVNGTYKTQTCSSEANNWDGNIHAVLQDAHEAGTCDNQTFEWGESIPDWLRWKAEKCCRSYPATLCEPDAKTMHPCVSDEDYMPEAAVHEWCDYGSIVEPSHETCEDAGFCHCHKPDACAHFGGQPRSETCEHSAHHQEDIRGLLKQAHEKGSCDDLRTPWNESLADSVRHTARKCCASYPSTFCEEVLDGS